MTRLVFLHGLDQALAERIAATAPPGIETVLVHRSEPEAQQALQLAQADFLLLYRAPMLEPVMRGARRLRMVQLLASGYDGIPLELLHALGVACARNGGANARAVADQAVLMMLALYRRLFETDREVRAGRWNAGITGLNTFEMAGKVVGIVGLGDIGRQVARRVQAFEAQVIYFQRHRLPVALEQELGVRHAPLDELLARLRALLRRTSVVEGDAPQQVAVDDLVIDAAARRVWRADRELELTKTEFDLLELLAINAGVVLSHSSIYDQIWGYDFGPDSKALAVYIGYLRRKTEESGEARIIQTVRGVGYTLRPA